MTFLLDPVPTGGSMYQEAVLGVLGRHLVRTDVALLAPGAVEHVESGGAQNTRLLSRCRDS